MAGTKLFRTLTLLGAAAMFVGGSARAQTTTEGAISGTVFDATNAAVPGAKIVIHNNQTNAEKTLTSNGSGYFKAPELDPGNYTVTITAAGFEAQKASSVQIEVNVVTEFNQHLTAGGESTVVDVSAATPVLDFESAAYGGHLENTEIESLPLNNRRWSTLALLTPGATVDTNGFGLINFRAISPLLNNVEIDGADDNQAFFSEERGRTRAGYSTAQSMIQEFNVNTGVYSAEYGRAVGGVINSVTKQGTNSIHGEAYFFNRKSSRSAFVPNSTITTSPSPGVYLTQPYKPSDNRNEFGFQAGGPFIKDKFFWAYAFDMFRRNFPGTAKANNPATFFAAPTPGAPAYNAPCSTTTGNVPSVMVNGKLVAPSPQDLAVCQIAARQNALTPGSQTYASAVALYNGQLASLLGDLGPVPRFGNQEINTPKLTYVLNNKHTINLLYHRLRWDSPGGVQTQGTNNYAVDTFGTDFVKLDYGLAKLNSVFSSRLTNELRYQYGRELDDEGQQPFSNYTKQFLQAANGNVPEVQLNTSVGFYLGSPYYSYRVAYPDERKWQIGDTASFQFGSHNLKFGEDFVHNYDLQNNLYESNGYYAYSTTGNYISDILSGGKATCDSTGTLAGTAAGGFYPCYQSFGQSFGQPILSVTTQDYGVFAQDDWKLSPRLTVNLGVRYDFELLPQPFAPNAALPQTTIRPKDGNNISPRVGFAWDPYGEGKTTVHGGFGIYYGRIFNAALLNALENTGAGVSATGATSQAAYSFSPTQGGAPLLPNVSTVIPPSGRSGAQASVEYLDPNFQNPYTEQFDFAIQQQLAPNTVFSLSYLGALGRELPNYLNFGLNPANRYNINYTVLAGSDGTCGPFACGTVLPVAVYSNKQQIGSTAGIYQYNTLNANYNGVTDVVSNVNSNYHALTVEVQRRAGKYFQFDTNYTWSHGLDFNQNTATAFTAGANNWFDPYGNARANYGNSSLNIPHRVVAWGLINFPGVHSGSGLSYLANGWSIKPLVQAQTGLDYSVLTTGNAPSQCASVTCLEFNSSGLSGTGVTYIPQLGRDTRHYPNVALFDVRVEKDFTFAERYNLQLIGEGFNLWNHDNVTGVNTTGYAITPNTTNPGQYAGNLTYQPSFGQVTSANSNYAYGPRQIQISARVVF